VVEALRPLLEHAPATPDVFDHDAEPAVAATGDAFDLGRLRVVPLDRNYVMSMEGALPATRFATDAYLRFVTEKSLLEAVASSLTELFAPSIHRNRITGMLENYDFIGENVMAYFRRRLDQAPKDVAFALDYVKRHARTPEAQMAVKDALRFKCNVLWAQLDALYLAYVSPGMIPPGAFTPDGMAG
jgi:pyrroloquinoline-quinone synthase